MPNSIHIIENRTSDLQACGAVRQPTKFQKNELRGKNTDNYKGDNYAIKTLNNVKNGRSSFLSKRL